MRYFICYLSLAISLLIFCYSGVTHAFAAFSLHIESIDPQSISSNDQPVTVKLIITDLPSESYFRIAWQEASGKPYFGYMKNNDGEWIKVDSGQDCKNYYYVSELSTQSLVLVTKVGQENAVNNGDYLLKARRYTASCSSYTDSDPITVQINFPTPTPTPTPTPEPTSTPTQTPTPTSTPTKTPTPYPQKIALSPTKIITNVNVVSPIKQQKDEEDKNIIVAKEKKLSYPTLVLGVKDEKNETQKNNTSSKKESIFFAPLNLILIFGGVFLLVVCAILIFLHKRSFIVGDYENKSE